MSNFTFTFNWDTLSLNADLEKALQIISNSPDTMDIDNIATIYHECGLSKSKDFLKIIHDLNESPINDTNSEDLIYQLDKNVLDTMIGDLKNWHVQRNGAGTGSVDGTVVNTLIYKDQGPDYSIPDQTSGGDADRDVDYKVDGTNEDKYPFSHKIVPMRVTAAYGSNMTDLLVNENELQTSTNNKIDQLKTDLLDVFHQCNNQPTSCTINGVANATNLGAKILGQAVYSAENETNTNNKTLKVNRLTNLFDNTNSLNNTIVDATTNEQTTSFVFEDQDEIKFALKLSRPNDLNNDGNNDNNTLSKAEPSFYKFLARLKFVKDVFNNFFYTEGQYIHYFNPILQYFDNTAPLLTLNYSTHTSEPFLTDISNTLSLEWTRKIYITDFSDTGDIRTTNNQAELFGTVTGYGLLNNQSYNGFSVEMDMSQEEFTAKYGLAVGGHNVWGSTDADNNYINRKYVLSVIEPSNNTHLYLAESQDVVQTDTLNTSTKRLLLSNSNWAFSMFDSNKNITW